MMIRSRPDDRLAPTGAAASRQNGARLLWRPPATTRPRGARAQAAQRFGEMHQLPALMVQIGANSAPIAGIPTD
jgi:hypothetical protein